MSGGGAPGGTRNGPCSIPSGDDGNARKRVETNRQWAAHFFEAGAGNRVAPVRGSLWAAFNGVAEFIDHGDRRRHPTADPDARRLQSVWFGVGSHAKVRAFAEAHRLLTADVQ